MKNLTVLTFKTLDTVFYVCCGKVTLARCIKTGRFVKLSKANKIFNSLLIAARKYVAANKAVNNGAYIAAKNMLDNTLKFFQVASHVMFGRKLHMITKNVLTMMVA